MELEERMFKGDEWVLIGFLKVSRFPLAFVGPSICKPFDFGLDFKTDKVIDFDADCQVNRQWECIRVY